MANLLFVTSSLFGDGSQSRLIASEFIDRWRQSHPRTTVVERELTADSIPHLSLATLAASATPADTRSVAERQAAALADTLIEEVEAADVIVHRRTDVQFLDPLHAEGLDRPHRPRRPHLPLWRRRGRGSAQGQEGIHRHRSRRHLQRQQSGQGAWTSRSRICGRSWVSSGLTMSLSSTLEGLKVSAEAAASGIERARQAIGDLLPSAAAA